ncbi:MAG TPA: hypothetical protein VIL88_06665 [Devosia sp.]|uniref:hypothetical protein n=1 Tax=Devosia sp. TaxID=1871048 RepID=UPI002F95CC89
MPTTSNDNDPRPETDIALTEQGRGAAERAVLGKNPMGSMARVILAVILFIVVFGTIFYFVQR